MGEQVPIEWGGEAWRLRADRTLWWADRRTLIVADPHFGKAAHFRGAGIPVPRGTTASNLERLSVALDATGAARLLVLGDFFHSRGGVTAELIEQLVRWRRRWDGVAMVNVRGNHDRQAGDPPSEVGVECVGEPWRDPKAGGVAFAHEPTVVSNAVTWAGHVHPGVVLEGPGKARMRAACFHVGLRTGVLPAFGAFTGMKAVRPSRGDRLFVVGQGQVAEVGGAPQRQLAEERQTQRAFDGDAA